MLDSNSARTGDESTRPLEKLFKALLEGTNWRLMSNGLNYRLGYVSGQLKGYENEEDLWAQTNRKYEQQRKSKVDDEKRMKYSSDPFVQLAKIVGHYEGIEEMRKKRLDKEPDGFFLDANEGPYHCGICYHAAPGEQIWWTPDGLFCIDCRRNIKEGIIPAISSRHDENWFTDYDVQYRHGIDTATRRKLIKEGLLKTRQLRKEDGRSYYKIYLVEENQEFLQQYPEKEDD